MTSQVGPKQVKVDNWGIFFLQRLEQSFEKGDFCDLTLRFATQTELKVHSLVLNACTEYFLALEKQGCLKNGYLELPSDLLPEVVIPIIRFMYTGKLELVDGLQHQLYVAAQQLHMSVLTKLLDAQRQPMHRPMPPKLPLRQSPPVTYSLQGKKIAPKSSLPIVKREKEDNNWPEPMPGRKLPIWKRRPPKQLPQSTSILGQPTQSEAAWAEGRKLEESATSKDQEPPRPTRFEWPESPSEFDTEAPFATITYESHLLSRPKSPTAGGKEGGGGAASIEERKGARVEVFEELRKNVCVKRLAGTDSLPPLSSEASQSEAKKLKLDIEEVREFVQEQRVRKEIITSVGAEGVEEEEEDFQEAGADMEDEEEEEEEEGGEEVQAGKEEVQQHAEEEAQKEEQVNEVQETVPPAVVPTVAVPQKSILRTQRTGPKGSKEVENGNENGSVQPKRVRFMLKTEEPEDSEKDAVAEPEPTTSTATTVNSSTATTATAVSEEASDPLSTASLPATPVRTQEPPGGINNLSNHARIISEVLKKYPQLVRDNKNIRLKIMQKGHFRSPVGTLGGNVTGSAPTRVGVQESGGSAEEVAGDDGSGGQKMVRSKVSYVVLKSGDRLRGGKQAVVIKKGDVAQTLSEIVNPNSQISGAENTTGPWLCYTCGTAEEPINFETYYTYRKHLQEVHQEKIDSRICEHCGHRASKRNLLLYHLYTKHSIPPPRNCQFPKCDQCGYIALSESLLIKHRNSHSHARDFVCKECNASFKSNGALQGHIQANLHGNHHSRKTYECTFCDCTFARNINLKAHLRSVHKRSAERVAVVNKEKLEVGRRRRVAIAGRAGAWKRTGAKGKVSVKEEEEEQEDDEDEEELVSQEDPPHLEQVEIESEQHKATTSTASEESSGPPPQLDPSSEAEALSNVASGIAASLGLVGDHLVEGAETHEVIVAYPPGTLVTDGTQQYIIPEVDVPDEQVTVSYAGPLSDLEHYGAATTTVAATVNANSSPSFGSSSVEVHDLPASTADEPTEVNEQVEVVEVVETTEVGESAEATESALVGEPVEQVVEQQTSEEDSSTMPHLQPLAGGDEGEEVATEVMPVLEKMEEGTEEDDAHQMGDGGGSDLQRTGREDVEMEDASSSAMDEGSKGSSSEEMVVVESEPVAMETTAAEEDLTRDLYMEEDEATRVGFAPNASETVEVQDAVMSEPIEEETVSTEIGEEELVSTAIGEETVSTEIEELHSGPLRVELDEVNKEDKETSPAEESSSVSREEEAEEEVVPGTREEEEEEENAENVDGEKRNPESASP